MKVNNKKRNFYNLLQLLIKNYSKNINGIRRTQFEAEIMELGYQEQEKTENELLVLILYICLKGNLIPAIELNLIQIDKDEEIYLNVNQDQKESSGIIREVDKFIENSYYCQIINNNNENLIQNLTKQDLYEIITNKNKINIDFLNSKLNFKKNEIENEKEEYLESSFSDLSECSLEVMDARTESFQSIDSKNSPSKNTNLTSNENINLGEEIKLNKEDEHEIEFRKKLTSLQKIIKNPKRIQLLEIEEDNSVDVNFEKSYTSRESTTILDLEQLKKNYYLPLKLSHFAKYKRNKSQLQYRKGSLNSKKTLEFSIKSPSFLSRGNIINNNKLMLNLPTIITKRESWRCQRSQSFAVSQPKNKKMTLLKPKIATINFRINEERTEKKVNYQPKFRTAKNFEFGRKKSPSKYRHLSGMVDKVKLSMSPIKRKRRLDRKINKTDIIIRDNNQSRVFSGSIGLMESKNGIELKY